MSQQGTTNICWCHTHAELLSYANPWPELQRHQKDVDLNRGLRHSWTNRVINHNYNSTSRHSAWLKELAPLHLYPAWSLDMPVLKLMLPPYEIPEAAQMTLATFLLPCPCSSLCLVCWLGRSHQCWRLNNTLPQRYPHSSPWICYLTWQRGLYKYD